MIFFPNIIVNFQLYNFLFQLHAIKLIIIFEIQNYFFILQKHQFIFIILIFPFNII